MVEKQAHLLYYRCCRGVWLSLVERYVRDVEVACSNHVTPTGTHEYHKAWIIGFVVFFYSKLFLGKIKKIISFLLVLKKY